MHRWLVGATNRFLCENCGKAFALFLLNICGRRRRRSNWKLTKTGTIGMYFPVLSFQVRPQTWKIGNWIVLCIIYRVSCGVQFVVSKYFAEMRVFPIQRHIHRARVSFFFSFPPCLKLHNIAPTLNELSLFGMMVLSFIPPKHPIIPFVFLPICVCHWRRRKKTSQRCGIYCVCVWCMQAQGERQSHGLNYKELHMQFWWNGAHHQYIHNRTLAHTRKEWARQRIHQYCDISIASTPHQSKLK